MHPCRSSTAVLRERVLMRPSRGARSATTPPSPAPLSKRSFHRGQPLHCDLGEITLRMRTRVRLRLSRIRTRPAFFVVGFFWLFLHQQPTIFVLLFQKATEAGSDSGCVRKGYSPRSQRGKDPVVCAPLNKLSASGVYLVR